VCLKQIARAVIRPTIAPPNAHGIAAAGLASSPVNVFDHVKQAEPMAKSSRNIVFWAVPLIVIVATGDCSAVMSRR
jgi:hypothetical protein